MYTFPLNEANRVSRTKKDKSEVVVERMRKIVIHTRARTHTHTHTHTHIYIYIYIYIY